MSACAGPPETGSSSDTTATPRQVSPDQPTAAPSQAATVASSPNAATATQEAPASAQHDERRDQLIDEARTLLNVADPKVAAEAMAPKPEQQDLKACVEDAGFEYYIYEPFANDPVVTMSPAEYAARWGLGITAQMLGTYPQPRTDDFEYLATLSETQRKAYEAVLKRCAEAASIDGSRNQAVSAAAERFRQTLATDKRVQSATTAWSECMSAQGHTYASPDDMRNDFYAALLEPGVDLDALLANEIKTAVANVSCEASYREAYNEVVSERFDEFVSMLDDPLPPTDGSNG